MTSTGAVAETVVRGRGGLWLAIGHAVTAVTLAITIIGIPMAYANLKMIPIALTPFGRRIARSHRLHSGPYVVQ